MTTRRGFLGAMLAAAMAPAIVKSTNLMQIVVPRWTDYMTLWGDGEHDDSAVIQSMLAGGTVMFGGKLLETKLGILKLPTGIFGVGSPILIAPGQSFDGSGSILLSKNNAPILELPKGTQHTRIENCHFQSKSRSWNDPQSK